MKNLLMITATAVCVILLSGCLATNQQKGAVLGGAAGGILGNQIGGGSGKTIATGVGVLLGTITGAAVGQNMDKPSTVIHQKGVIPGQCSNIENSGVRSSCQRGLADRKREEQRRAEQRAYQCSRYGKCNE
tara:strand:- start:453 stop:845 length:393 start_codon:yes stop_codon:yes gene_type:complete